MTPSDPDIDYEALVQTAMRGVVRAVLTQVAGTGRLPGDHHFYISFNTRHPGAILSKRLREKYPEEMTVVLQHRFWELIVSEDRFEVKLTFDSIPERLVVPFDAIRVFFDPSVRFGHQFEEPGQGPIAGMTADATRAVDNPAALPRSNARVGAKASLDNTATPLKSDRKRAAPAAKAKRGASGPDEATRIAQDADVTADAAPSRSPAPAPGSDQPADNKADAAAASKVVRLDQFRKK